MQRRTGLTVFVMGAALWAACGPGGARASVVKGPYLQAVRYDRVTVALETDSYEDCEVRWGEGLANSTPLVASGMHHEGRIEGLVASTCYPYQVACGAETSPQSSFCTAPMGDEPFRFVVFGDTRSDHQAHQDVVNAIAAEGVDFYINTGDLVADGSSEDDWATFFEIEGELLRQLPMFPVVGNHDESGGAIENYGRLFAVPGDGSDSENYYAFTYGNARFIVLDNQAASLGRPEDETAQGRWLAAELERSAADPMIAHRFVFVHANMYSVKDGRSGDEGLRLWQDSFVEHGVEAVFAGHDHHYVRGRAGNGLPFVITGGGGAPLYDIREGFETQGTPLAASVFGWLPEPGDKPFTLDYTAKLHNYLVVDVQGDRWTATTKQVLAGGSGPGVEFDSFDSAVEQPDPDPDQPPAEPPGGCATGDSPGGGPGALIVIGALVGVLLLVGRRRQR